MSGLESVMWELERDPQLSAAFANLTMFDRPPDRAAFTARMGRATLAVPRLRQRVVATHNPLGHPRWAEDPDFDLDHHLRWVDLGGRADDRELYDLAAGLMRQPFDRERPLWEFVTIEGLSDGRAAMLQRLHHTITDGEGGIRLSVEFLDFQRDPDHAPATTTVAPRPAAGPDQQVGPAGDADRNDQREGEPRADAIDAGPTGTDTVATATGIWARSSAALGGAAAAVTNTAAAIPRRGSEFTSMARSTLRQVTVGSHRSTLWNERSLQRWLGTAVLSLDDVRDAAHELGGSVNDLFVCGAASAAGRIHADAGRPVDELRVSMPVSTRHDRSMGGNAFSPTQTLVPTGEMSPAERFAAIHEILDQVKHERSVDALAGVADAAALLPSAAVVRTGQHLAGAVDFVCSNVKAAPFDLFIGGALMEANYPLGPLAGTAFNLTTMSYRGWLYLGLVTDPAAVANPEELLDELRRSYAELLRIGGVRRPRSI